MLLSRHSLETNSRPEALWRRWMDVGTWPDWDRSLESACVEGPFQPGCKGSLVFQDGLRLGFTITQFEPGQTFVLETPLAGAVLRMDHRLEPSPHGTRISREIRLQGWLAWFHAWRLGAALREGLPPALRALARMAERPL